MSNRSDTHYGNSYPSHQHQANSLGSALLTLLFSLLLTGIAVVLLLIVLSPAH